LKVKPGGTYSNCEALKDNKYVSIQTLHVSCCEVTGFTAWREVHAGFVEGNVVRSRQHDKEVYKERTVEIVMERDKHK
jgi:hypothetical protein